MPTLTAHPKRQFRIDPQHQLLGMMQKAVARIQGVKVQIQLESDSVRLQGTVQCWYQKQHVQESLRSLTGSRVIENSLQVTGA